MNRFVRAGGPWRVAGPVMALALLAACEELGEPVVLTVGSRSITEGELRARHSDLDARDRPPLTSREERLRFVDRYVDRLLLREHGESLLAAGAPQLEARLRQAREEALLARLQVLVGSEAALDSAAVRQAYDRMCVSHRVQLAWFGSEEAARDALARIEAGTPFERFLDPSDARAEYWAAWSAMSDPVTDVLPGTEPGEIVGPDFVRSGWRLLRVVDSRVVDPGELTELRARILQGLMVRSTLEGAQRVVTEWRAKSPPHIDEAVVQKIAEGTCRAILTEDATEDDAAWAVPVLDPDESARVVATWAGGQLTAGDYVAIVTGLARGQRPRAPVLALRIRTLVGDAVDRALLLEEAERRHLAGEFWAARSLRLDREEILVQAAITDLEGTVQGAAGSDSLLQILRESQPQLFRRDARARILRFDLPTREAAQRELEAIRRAGGGEAYLRSLLEGDEPMGANYHVLDLEYRNAPDLPLRDEIFEGGVGTLSGPHELLGSWVAMVCLDLDEGREYTAEEMQEFVSNRTGTGGAVVAQWLAQRRAERGVSIDEDALDALGPGS